MICKKNILTSTLRVLSVTHVFNRTKKRCHWGQYLKTNTHDSNRTSPNIDIYWYSDIVWAKNKTYRCFLWKVCNHDQGSWEYFVILGLCRLTSPEKPLVSFISSKARLVPRSGGGFVTQFVDCVLSNPTVLCERPEVSQIGLLKVTTSPNYRL